MKFFLFISLFAALCTAMERKAEDSKNATGGGERRHHRRHGEGGEESTGHRRHHRKEGGEEKREVNREITSTAETALAALKRTFVPSKITTDDPAASFSHLTEVFNSVKKEVEHKHNTVNKLNAFLSPEVRSNLDKILLLASESMKDEKLKECINDPGNREAVKKTFALFKSEIQGGKRSSGSGGHRRHHHGEAE